MNFFWIFWGIDAVIALIFFYFFFVGIADGSVSSFNAGLWFLLLTVLGAVLIGGYWLHTHQHEQGAKILLGLLAIPGLLCGLFFLILILTNPRWN
ncbi:osmoprotectant transporter permease [Spirosoma sp. KCTC 42546]|uniref:osmoprotectant transporter permease n=1 Tax=Spirosoma sp. KCTC 42546 TaxID=2520506 RepID=UPI00115AF2C8|nr:osmoprotectant transporter permease [Spirosoma sp. KCTC 42546]QDK79978.1 osmoprotectant transporter permease [Spirosoma sp. KCTC 42546]